jgi:hypothetical protein
VVLVGQEPRSPTNSISDRQHHQTGMNSRRFIRSPRRRGRGSLAALTKQRAIMLDAAFAAHPIRFKGVAPKSPVLPTAAWINSPKKGVNTRLVSRSTPACAGGNLRSCYRSLVRPSAS